MTATDLSIILNDAEPIDRTTPRDDRGTNIGERALNPLGLKVQPGSSSPSPYLQENLDLDINLQRKDLSGEGSSQTLLNKPMSEEKPAAEQIPVSRLGNPLAITGIENMIERIVENLLAKEDLSIELKTKKPRSDQRAGRDTFDVGLNKLRFLSSNAQEAWRFSM